MRFGPRSLSSPHPPSTSRDSPAPTSLPHLSLYLPDFTSPRLSPETFCQLPISRLPRSQRQLSPCPGEETPCLGPDLHLPLPDHHPSHALRHRDTQPRPTPGTRSPRRRCSASRTDTSCPLRQAARPAFVFKPSASKLLSSKLLTPFRVHSCSPKARPPSDPTSVPALSPDTSATPQLLSTPIPQSTRRPRGRN